MLYLLFAAIIPVACAEERADVSGASSALTVFLKCMSKGEYDKVYMMFDSQTQMIQLGDAILGLRRIESDKNDIEKSAKASDVFKRYYDKEAAIIDYKNAKGELTEPERILLQIRHISSPSKFYHEWLVLAGAHPTPLKNASINDFKIEISGDKAHAKGESELHVEMIFENGMWRIRENWVIRHKD